MFRIAQILGIGFIVALSSITSFSQSGTMIIQSGDTTYFDIQPDEEEFEILKEFYESTGGENWRRNSNWLEGKSSEEMNKWYGITVENGDVVGIVLDKNKLTGIVPSSLYKLVRLRNVNLENNDLEETGFTQNKNIDDKLKKVRSHYGFIENLGQVVDQNQNPNSEVKYVFPLPNNTVLLKTNGFSYDTYITDEKERAQEQSNSLNDKFREKDITLNYHRVDIEFVNANKDVQLITDELSEDYINYFINDAEISAHYFGKVTYKNIYNGIDVEFIASPGKKKPIEYNFIVHPGADINQIQLRYSGATTSELIEGKVSLTLAHGNLSESIPESYWKESKATAKIDYKEIAKNSGEITIGFSDNQLSKRANETLIIDPTPNLSWSIQYGGGVEITTDLVIDPSNNVYITGYTYSSSNIATSGAHQTVLAGGSDAFVAKFNSSGTLLWGTYYGGSGDDIGFGVSVDIQGYVVVAGRTTSTSNISTPGSHQVNIGTPSTYDGFIVKFNSTGSRQWGTYYGGLATDVCQDVSVDLNSNIYVIGHTGSGTQISTAGAYQVANAGLGDAFFVKFSSSGVRQWGTYYGTPQIEYEGTGGIVSDSQGNFYVLGSTSTTTSTLSTPGTHQQTPNGGYTDIYIAKFNTSGGRVWGTYFGGESSEFGTSISIDAIGNLFITGTTGSSFNIATPGTHKITKDFSSETFVAKFNGNGLRIWSTYYGGEQGNAIDSDETGNVYIIGLTLRTSSIATPNGYQTTFGGGSNDAYLAKFNRFGKLTWGTYFGQNSNDAGWALAVSSSNEVFASGAGFPTGNSSQGSAFLSKFSIPCTEVTQGLNLPHWALGVVGPKDKQVNWRQSPPTSSDLVNSTSQTVLRSSAVAIDQCGRLAFYLMFTGSDVANRLHIYSSNGTRLTNETGPALLALNSASGTTEVQVVQVTGTTDEWYIIYSSYQTPCSGASGYCPANVVYARVRYISSTSSLTIIYRDINVSSAYRYTQGKAISAHINGDYSKNYLYLAERASGSSTTRFHRFTIDGSGIHSREISAVTIPAQWFSLTISGSSLELSDDGRTLAMVNRNENVGYNDIFVFDVSKFAVSSYVPIIIKVPDLMVDLDWHGIMLRKSVTELYSVEPYKSEYSCLEYMKNKLTGIQFSPSGQYLYVTNGGYKQVSSTQRTYLLQIDVKNPDVNGKYSVRIQTQNGVETSSCGVAPSGSIYTPISLIQAGYDGRIYFSKGSTNKLFVIPEPDCVMPQNLSPADVDLSTPDVPNITINGITSVAFFPEQIDGYMYPAESDPVPGTFTLDKISAEIDESFTFTLTNYNASNTYQLSWGDGVVQNVTSILPVMHTYSSEGSYQVLLTTYIPGTCPVTSVQPVGVTNCSDLVGLDIQSSRYICAVKFSTKKLSNCLTTYLWNFGDGTTSADRNPLHAYNVPGTYNVRLNISYNCSSCVGDTLLTKQISYSTIGSILEDQIVQVVTYQKSGVLSNSVSTFSDAWALQHEASAIDDKSGYLNGSEGVWRNDASFVYETPRQLSSPANTKLDGTYLFNQFNWTYADLNAVPNWIKANAMTQYSPYSYELENEDVLGVYSAALYDYAGQLPVANGINMRNKEMAFTSFESLTGISTGNWIFGTQTIPEYNQYVINSGNKNMAVVEASLKELQGATKADVTIKPRGQLTKKNGTFFKDNEIICTTVHPNTTEWSLVVFKTAPTDYTWSGIMRIKNQVNPLVIPDIDNTVAHTGKSSLKINTEKTFSQNLLELDSGKSYWINAWVSVGNPQAVSPVPPSGLGFDIIVRRKNGQLVTTLPPFQPSGPIIEGWQQIKGPFTCPINQAVIEIKFKPGSAGTAWFDDLRLHPENGNMKSYVYSLDDYRLRAILDEENFASFFYYDVEGNLYLTKKETKEGVKTLTENVTYQVER